MNKRILIRDQQYVVNALWCNGKIEALDVDDISKEPILGAIYIGKIKNIVKNINAAFLEIGDGQIGYYFLEDSEPILAKDMTRSKLCVGDELVVQVVKEGMKTKDPVVSSKISLSGRYTVLTHQGSGIAFSKKIKKNSWKRQIKAEIPEQEYPGVEILFRTNAQYVSTEEIKAEIASLYEAYKNILHNAKYRTVYSCLYKPESSYLKTVRDTYSESLETILTDDSEIYESLASYLKENFPKEAEKLQFYEDDLLPLEKRYSIKVNIEKALRERVWLKSGAYLIIQPTEALVSIDVNSGKAVAGKQATEEHFYKINKEAAEEIARQLRLRNLSGMIIVDFINMKQEENRQKLLEFMQKAVADDPVKTVAVDITKLNLIEITRKKEKKPLHELYQKEA